MKLKKIYKAYFFQLFPFFLFSTIDYENKLFWTIFFVKAKASILVRQVSTLSIKNYENQFLMTEMAMKPKNRFFIKTQLKKIILNQKEPKLPKNYFIQFLFGHNHYKTDGPAFQKSLKLNHFIINYRSIYFLKFDNANSLQQKRAFITVS